MRSVFIAAAPGTDDVVPPELTGERKWSTVKIKDARAPSKMSVFLGSGDGDSVRIRSLFLLVFIKKFELFLVLDILSAVSSGVSLAQKAKESGMSTRSYTLHSVLIHIFFFLFLPSLFNTGFVILSSLLCITV